MSSREQATHTNQYFAGAHNFEMNNPQFNNNNYYTKTPVDVQQKLVEKLKPISGAWMDKNKICLEGTRMSILKEISEWIYSSNESASQVLFLCGEAGTGKSTISHTIGSKHQNILGAFFCFDRTLLTTRTPWNAMRTIAYHLAIKATEIGYQMLEALGAYPYILESYNVEDLWKSLIVQSSQAMTDLDQPVLIVIDALDESGAKEDVERENLLSLIVNGAHGLPKNFRVLVTSRPEYDVIEHLHIAKEAPNTKLLRIKYMDEIKGTQDDILLRAGITVPERFKRVMNLKKGNTNDFRALDELYIYILKETFDVTDVDDMDRYKFIMSQVLAAFEPLSQNALQNLQPENSISKSDDAPVKPVHISVFDFLLNEECSKQFCLSQIQGHKQLATGAFKVMFKNLHFNMANLKNSHVLNSEIEDLDKKVFVILHTEIVLKIWNAQTGEATGRILQGHSEAVTCIAFSPDGEKIVSGSWDETVRIWNVETGETITGPLLGHSHCIGSVAFSADGNRIISSSLDHIIKIWDAKTGSIIGNSLNARENHFPVHILSSSFSPNCKKAVARATDTTLMIWNTETGRPIGDVIKGHTDYIITFSFSPDGQKIVSGSSDKTIRIWNAETGKPIGVPLLGHSDQVASVTFSPDSKRILSGSVDKSIKVWNAEIEKVVNDQLYPGHSHRVSSVVFSPDGKKIASGSFDNTIRIWDSETGEPIGNPLHGHSNWIKSVAFSPDGTKLASGSFDKTIRLWDVQTGHTIGFPLKLEKKQAAKSWICSVTFSPNGKQLASGQSDGGIIVWPMPAPSSQPLSSISEAADSHPWNGRSITESGYMSSFAMAFPYEEAEELDFGSPFNLFSPEHVVIYTADGATVLSGYADGKVKRLRINEDKPTKDDSSWNYYND
ncbi:WD40-repeat-containing domain protein [Lentinula raphanica]|nr:WD40-repeat-containing domain protein [Lentinula raphanica]